MTKNLKRHSNTSNQTKTAKIVTSLQHNTGATIAELTKATGWQRHSMHGFMSGTPKKKLGLKISGSKEVDKDRRYLIEAGAQ